MGNIETLTDSTRLKCGWMTSSTWKQLKDDLPFITDALEQWTYHLIRNDFDVQKACPAANNAKYTFGEISDTCRADWTLYSNTLREIYNKE